MSIASGLFDACAPNTDLQVLLFAVPRYDRPDGDLFVNAYVWLRERAVDNQVSPDPRNWVFTWSDARSLGILNLDGLTILEPTAQELDEADSDWEPSDDDDDDGDEDEDGDEDDDRDEDDDEGDPGVLSDEIAGLRADRAMKLPAVLRQSAQNALNDDDDDDGVVENSAVMQQPDSSADMDEALEAESVLQSVGRYGSDGELDQDDEEAEWAQFAAIAALQGSPSPRRSVPIDGEMLPAHLDGMSRMGQSWEHDRDLLDSMRRTRDLLNDAIHKLTESMLQQGEDWMQRAGELEDAAFADRE